MSREREEHLVKRFKEAKEVYRDSGPDGLYDYLCSFSYGGGDKFCNMDLISIMKAAESRDRHKDYQLWEKVKKFIREWDMTAPLEQGQSMSQ